MMGKNKASYKKVALELHKRKPDPTKEPVEYANWFTDVLDNGQEIHDVVLDDYTSMTFVDLCITGKEYELDDNKTN